MTEQSNETSRYVNKMSNCIKESVDVRNSLREIAQDDSAQARALADALIKEKDPNGDILAGLISPGKARDAISQEEITSFKPLHDNFFPENAAAVTFSACLKRPADRGR